MKTDLEKIESNTGCMCFILLALLFLFFLFPNKIDLIHDEVKAIRAAIEKETIRDGK